jgi:hypothetical protein
MLKETAAEQQTKAMWFSREQIGRAGDGRSPADRQANLMRRQAKFRFSKLEVTLRNTDDVVGLDRR